jgi:hypothetical protein
MPVKYVIESYAWIEYFMGTQTGEKVRPIIEGVERDIPKTRKQQIQQQNNSI